MIYSLLFKLPKCWMLDYVGLLFLYSVFIMSLQRQSSFRLGLVGPRGTDDAPRL